MEMWLKHAALVLFIVAGAAMESPGETVTLYEKGDSPSERNVTVPPGFSLTFNCSLNNLGTRYRVLWYFSLSKNNFTESNLICQVIVKSANNSSKKPQEDLKKDCYDRILDLKNVKETNAGWYYCKVMQEIPDQRTNESQKLRLIIAKSLVERTTYVSVATNTQVPPESNADWWMWVLLGVSSLILIVLLVVCIVHIKRARRSREEEPVYANTPKYSEDTFRRKDLDNLKTVPSPRNLRTPSPRRYEEGTRRNQ